MHSTTPNPPRTGQGQMWVDTDDEISSVGSSVSDLSVTKEVAGTKRARDGTALSKFPDSGEHKDEN